MMLRLHNRGLVGLVAAVALTACSTHQILDVQDPDVARPEAVQDATALPSLLAGAIGEFSVAYNGGGDFNIITLSGQLADEFINTETFPTRIEVDRRTQQPQSNGSLRDLYYDVHQARNVAERTAEAYERLDAANVGHAEALNLAGLTYIFLAENYCGAVPISVQKSPGVFEFGNMLTTNQLLDSAIAMATRAKGIADAAGGAAGTAQSRLARIVQARALLDQNKPAEASAAIGGETGVPSTYQYIYKHSQTTTRQNNGTWAVTVSVARFGVADREGTNGLPFRSEGDTNATVKDPRIPSLRRGGTRLGFDGATPQWEQRKYPLRDTLVVIADGVEARLIEAEAQLRGGDVPGAFATLNTLRGNGAVYRTRGYVDANNQPRTQGALTPGLTTAEQVDQLFKERAYWLFLTGHRLSDLRRLIRQYGRNAESVFPTGNYHKGGTYGTDVNTPVPQAEENNPNFQRSACKANEA